MSLACVCGVLGVFTELPLVSWRDMWVTLIRVFWAIALNGVVIHVDRCVENRKWCHGWHVVILLPMD